MATIESQRAVPDPRMSASEIENFLDVPRYVSVASLRKTGAPIVVAMSFLYRDASMFITTGVTRGLHKRLKRDDRVSCVVFNESFPTAYVLFEGTAVEIDDTDARVNREIMERYLDPRSSTLAVKDLDFDTFHANWVAEHGAVTYRIEATRKVGYDAGKKGGATELARFSGKGLSEAEQARR